MWRNIVRWGEACQGRFPGSGRSLPGASAVLEDFINRLKIGLTSEGPDDMQALAFDFTDFLGFSAEDGYKLQAVARDPVLFEALSTGLSEENRDKRTK